MHWLLLFLAAGFEIAWAVGLKYTYSFTRLWPTVGVIVALVASVGLLALAARGLPIGTAYAVWTGIGAVGTTIYGIAYFGEARDWPRVACIALIIAGIVGLKALSRA